MTDQKKFSVLGFAVWLVAALFFLYEFFLRTFVGTVAHQIIPDLHLTAETFALVSSGYYIAYGIMQVPVGVFVDKFGVKKVMIFATFLCAVATYIFSQSQGFNSAFASRLLMGFGSSFAFVCLLVIAVTWFPARLFGFFAGISQFIGTMGPLLSGGPLIAWIHASHTTWRHALFFIACFGIVLMLLVIFIVRNKPRDGEQALLYLKREESLKVRLKRLVSNGQVWAVAFYSACVYFASALLGAVWGTQYLQGRGLTQASAAGIISLIWLGYAIGCPALGAISDAMKRRKPVLVLSAVIGLFVTCSVIYLPIHQNWLLMGLFFLIGIAASGQNVGFAAIAEHSDLSTQATALGLNNGMITVFSAIFPPLVSLLIAAAAHGRDAYIASDFVTGFSIMPIMYILAIILAAFMIKETFGRPQKEALYLFGKDPHAGNQPKGH